MKASIVNRLARYDDGALSEQETVELFQALINTGHCWQLDGRYTRIAMALIRDGRCAFSRGSDALSWRNIVPSRESIEPGGVGSAEYVEEVTGAPPLDGGEEA